MTQDATHDTAGAGSRAPAVSSPDVLDPRARVELERLARRWGELPLGRAEGRMPLLRAALDTLADVTVRPTRGRMAPEPPAEGGSRPLGVAGAHDVEVGEGGSGGRVDAAEQGSAVPDLGPSVVLDQLAVLVWDAYAAGHGDGIPDLLIALRRELG